MRNWITADRLLNVHLVAWQKNICMLILPTDRSAVKDEVDDNDAQVVGYDESEMNDKDNKQILHHCIGLPLSAVGLRIFLLRIFLKTNIQVHLYLRAVFTFASVTFDSDLFCTCLAHLLSFLCGLFYSFYVSCESIICVFNVVSEAPSMRCTWGVGAMYIIRCSSYV